MFDYRLARTCFLGLVLCLFLFVLPSSITADEPESSESGLGFMHPLQVDRAVLHHCPHPHTTFCRLHTYTFFINGIDPVNLGNFYGLCQFVKAHGYPQTYFGQMTHGNRYFEKIRYIHQHDPYARIVLVGFSGGTYVVRRLANDLMAEGVPIDLLVYIGGDMIYNDHYSQPDNACRILNITGHGFCLTGGNLFFNGDTLDRAMNLRIPVRHFALPSHRDTIQSLMSELNQMTCIVPVTQTLTVPAAQVQP